MDAASIERFISSNNKKSPAVNIHFKDRSTVTGVFIVMNDYDELRAKNFWRVVNIRNLPSWEKSKDVNVSRLFNGAAFTRLSHAAQ